MEYLERYNAWLADEFIDDETKEELKSLKIGTDDKEIEDRFYKDLEFGTGGMRGIMGAGTNRMNKYTIGKATLGLANYLLSLYKETTLLDRGVVIAYDVRKNSDNFSRIVASVLSSKGIRVYLFDRPVPTPELSFAVRHYNCVAGIVVTASHNPKEYNGYKVYDDNGCQLVPELAEKLITYVDAIENFSQINFVGNSDLIELVNCTDEFVNAVLKQSVFDNKEAKANLKIVYTPLHGTGNIPIRKALKLDGFSDVNVVSEQEQPDGDFPTVKSPNPEEHSALTMGIELGKKLNADIVFGSDPDSDRVGIAVNNGSEFKLISGNQVGILLVDYICRKKDFSKINRPAIIKSIVTNELGEIIAKKHGITVFSTLTGFKNICGLVNEFEKARTNNDEERAFTFVMGYEESYGYLIGDHARDKDAVVSSMIICEMCAELKSQNKTVCDRLEEIYNEYGQCKDALDSFTFKGKDGLEKINSMMVKIRNESVPFDNIETMIDYTKEVPQDYSFGLIPKSNVLKFFFKDKSWIAIRPSGTEPKIKIYYSIKGKTKEETEENYKRYRSMIKEKLGIED